MSFCEGIVAVVTGAGGTHCSCLAIALAKKGAKVVLIGRMAAIFALALSGAAWAAPSHRVFTEDTTVFCNPGQGWSTMGCNAEQYAGIVNIGQVYHRPTWRDFGPSSTSF